VNEVNEETVETAETAVIAETAETAVIAVIVREQTVVTEAAGTTNTSKRSGSGGDATRKMQGGAAINGPPMENRRILRMIGKGKTWSGICQWENPTAAWRIALLVTSASSTKQHTCSMDPLANPRVSQRRLTSLASISTKGWRRSTEAKPGTNGFQNQSHATRKRWTRTRLKRHP